MADDWRRHETRQRREGKSEASVLRDAFLESERQREILLATLVDDIMTEWAHRSDDGRIVPMPSEPAARAITRCGCQVVSRKVTYGEWQDA